MRDRINFRSARVTLEIMCEFRGAIDEISSVTNYRLLGVA